MRILFIIPPYRTTDRLVAQLYPMPLAAVLLGTILRHQGHEVQIKDFLLPAQISKTNPPASFAGKHAPAYLHFGTPLDGCIDWLKENAKRFDAVGLCVGQCNLWETSLEISRIVRELGLPLVVGGSFASTAPDTVAQLLAPSVLVRGEAEGVIERAFQSAVDVEERRETLIIHGEPADLASLPVPDWSMAPPEHYPEYSGKVRGVIFASRGCPHQCTFCSVNTVHGRHIRRLPIESLRTQIISLWNIGVRYFCFIDDNLFVNERSIREVTWLIKDLRSRVPGFSRARFYAEEGLEVRTAALR